MHEKKSFQMGLFRIGPDSLVFKGESPSATLEIWPKSVHCYSLSDGGGWSKMKVSFLVSSQSILKRLSRNFATITVYPRV